MNYRCRVGYVVNNLSFFFFFKRTKCPLNHYWERNTISNISVILAIIQQTNIYESSYRIVSRKKKKKNDEFKALQSFL